MIENYLLEQFLVVARCGTLVKASKELHLSQPALSRSMKKLEAELGVSLFVRDAGRMRLSETGKLAAVYAQEAIDANRTLQEQVRAFDARLHTVVIGTCAPMPADMLAPIVREVSSRHLPRFEMDTDEGLLAGLHDRRYQLVVLHKKPDLPDMHSARFGEEQLCIALTPQHPLASKVTVSFKDLKDHLILMAPNIGFWKDVCLAHLSASNLLVQSSWGALGRLVTASTLPVFSSSYMAKRGTDAPGRRTVPLRDDDARTDYWLTCLSSEAGRYQPIFDAVRI